MMKIIFLNLFLVASFSTAQTPPPNPKIVINCKMEEGGAQLTQMNQTQFKYVGSYGFDGAMAGGEAKIQLTKDKNKCTLNVVAGKGLDQINKSFAWTINPDGNPTSISVEKALEENCQIKQRYSKSIAQCIMPSPQEPGNQCHNEAGKDLTAQLPSGNPVITRKLITYSGGMTLETDPGSQHGFSVLRDPKNSQSWCYKDYFFPTNCKKLDSRIEIKNKDNQIIAVVEPQAEKVLLKQTKQPYSTSGFEVDTAAPIISLSYSNSATEISALSKDGKQTGSLHIQGSQELPGVYTSYRKATVNLLDGSHINSDCNGIISDDQKNSTQKIQE